MRACACAYACVCVCVTVQLSLYQVHPGTDLVVKRLNVFQQVQLTLGHRHRSRLLRVCVCVVLSFHAGVSGCFWACHHVCVCAGISWFLVNIFPFNFLQTGSEFWLIKLNHTGVPSAEDMFLVKDSQQFFCVSTWWHDVLCPQPAQHKQVKIVTHLWEWAQRLKAILGGLIATATACSVLRGC